MKIRALLVCCLLMTLAAPATASEKGPWAAETFQGLKLRGIGPALMSGRISDIGIHPTRRSTWYVAVGSGGVWKTENSGTTWSPLFDSQPSYSIGCLTLDPSNPEVIWVGTGENSSGRHVGYGDGVYRSLDGGKTWKRMGLEKSEHIGRILVHPKDGNVVYVAAEGPLWSSGGDRGLYKTVDGGETWSQVLYISDDTGVTDIEFDPSNPDVLYAASYQRRRHVWGFLGGGTESGLHKSSDGGKTWRKLQSGLPRGDLGKIGLAVSPVEPSHVYATIEADPKDRGFYRSTNFGESWEKMSAYLSGGTGPHYYQEIYASPHRLDVVYQMDVWTHVTTDGGKTFQRLGEQYKHPDNHALAFVQGDPDYLLSGTDGGLYESWDHGKTWKFAANLPVTQFYKLAIDNDFPFYNVMGGTQDNNSQLGPSRTLNVNGIRNEDWLITLGGDGHGCQIDPVDPNIVYTEWQVGNLYRYDKATGQRVGIKPQPEPDDPPERWNWDAPILISPHQPSRLYFGSQRIWRSDDRGDSWRAVSPDLTLNQNRFELPIMGRVWSVDSLFDHYAMSWYNSTTSISESPLVEGLLYVGTDDGLIQISEDGGDNWRRVDMLPDVPRGFYVNEVKASARDADTVYAAVDHHKYGDLSPYLLISRDRGRNWASIRGDLPDRHLVWSVVDDQQKEGLIFVGTEFGVFFTVEGGSRWIKLGGGAPNIPFRDLEIQRRENDLVGATFGRGFYILDDFTPLREVDEEILTSPGHLFPIKDTLLYVPSDPLGDEEKAFQGAAYFTAPNPPFGAVFTYYLGEGVKTRREQRHEVEKKQREEGVNTVFPGWDALDEERRDDQPQTLLTVTDQRGQVVRRLTGPAAKGFHRVAWDLRFPATEPVRIRGEEAPAWMQAASGPLVTPGRYVVRMSRIHNGREEALGGTQEFEVRPLGGESIPSQDPDDILSFQRETAEALRQALGAQRRVSELQNRLNHLQTAVLGTPGVAVPILEEMRRLSDELQSLGVELDQANTVREQYREADVPGIVTRLRSITAGHWQSTYGPTATHRRSLEIAVRDLEQVMPELRKAEADLQQLERRLEAAGAPYTPGREF